MISVVIPTYNREKTLMRAVQSVLDQTADDLEIIIVDDGSQDHTADVARSIGDARVRYFRLMENRGAAHARNAGIRYANGEYIAFLDSDDAWEKDKLKKQLDALERTGCDVCLCNMLIHDEGGKGRAVVPNLKTGTVAVEQILQDFIVGTPMILSRRTVFQETVFDETLRNMEDYEWGVRASQKCTFYFLEDVLVNVYPSSNSITKLDCRTYIESFSAILASNRSIADAYPIFERAMLNAIARNKVFSGLPACDDLLLAYKAAPSFKGLVKFMLCKFNLYPLSMAIAQKTGIRRF